MENWIIWLILGIIVFTLTKILFMRFKFFSHKFSWILLFFLAIFLIGGFFMATSGKGIELGTKEGLKTGLNLYVVWLGNGLNNLQSITTHAIKLDWSGNNTSIE